MLSNSRNGIVLAVGIVVGFAASLGHSVFAERPVSDQSNGYDLEGMQTLSRVMSEIRRNYVEPVDNKEMLENAIRGMLTGLDPHSSYLDRSELQEMTISTTGKFGGLGIEVQMQDGFVKVVAPIDDTPAQRAGVQAQDLIIRLDDQPVKGMTLNEAVKIMRGEPGTTILLTVVREGEEAPLKIELTRAIIRVKSVKSRMLEDGYGYVRLSQFRSRTGPNMIEELSKLKQENKGQLKGLVLDLRNNPGGVLNAAYEVADAFLDTARLENRLIVYTQGREESSRQPFNAKPGDVMEGSPIIVLVNGGSASASEIVAGALQDHKRALIVGTRSFGKGSVQSIIPLPGDVAIKLTTARYYTPSGRSIQAEGIQPDIPLERLKVTAVKDEFKQLKEADLKGRLDGDDKDTNGKGAANKEDEKANLAQSDHALYQALNLLKALSILQDDEQE